MAGIESFRRSERKVSLMGTTSVLFAKGKLLFWRSIISCSIVQLKVEQYVKYEGDELTQQATYITANIMIIIMYRVPIFCTYFES